MACTQICNKHFLTLLYQPRKYSTVAAMSPRTTEICNPDAPAVGRSGPRPGVDGITSSPGMTFWYRAKLTVLKRAFLMPQVDRKSSVSIDQIIAPRSFFWVMYFT